MTSNAFSRGAVMVVWFCRQVEFSWTQTKWEQAQQMMCRGRSVKERKQIGALPQHLTGAARAKTLGINPEHERQSVGGIARVGEASPSS